MKNTNTYNVLLLDDNNIIAELIILRLLKTSKTFYETTQIEINPIHLQIDINNLSEARQKIKDCIIDRNIHFLLLDRGFFEIVDPGPPPNTPNNISELDPDTLYVRKDAQVIKVNEILNDMNFSDIKPLKGIVLYTYDRPSRLFELVVEPAKIEKELMQIFGNKLNPENIDIVLTYSENYQLAGLELYPIDPKDIGNYSELGKKSDFMLYGLFMGEILYHRILKIIDKRQKKTLSKKKISVMRKLIIIFVIFTSLSIGGNASYNYALKMIPSDLKLIVLSLVFAIAIPWWILITKPEWILNLDDDL